jgi:hypothetical protein
MRWLSALLALAASAAAPARAGERISLPRLGIALTAPDGWERISPEEAVANLPQTGRDRAGYQREISRIRRPIIALRRTASAQPGMPMPILNVLFNQLIADRTALEVLQRTARVSRGALADLRFLDPPHSVRISGLPAAHMRIAYRLEQGGDRISGISEYWVVVRGGYFFSFSAGYGPDEPRATRAAIQAAIDGVRIEPAG